MGIARGDVRLTPINHRLDYIESGIAALWGQIIEQRNRHSPNATPDIQYMRVRRESRQLDQIVEYYPPDPHEVFGGLRADGTLPFFRRHDRRGRRRRYYLHRRRLDKSPFPFEPAAQPIPECAYAFRAEQ